MTDRTKDKDEALEITRRPFTRFQAKELQNKVVRLSVGNKEDGNCGRGSQDLRRWLAGATIILWAKLKLRGYRLGAEHQPKKA